MDEVTITIGENGPFKVEGPVRLLDHRGEVVETREGKAFYLCRCGGSTRKPFCDGTHSKVGFKGAQEAVEAAQAE